MTRRHVTVLTYITAPLSNDDRRTTRYGKLRALRRHRLHPLGDTELRTDGGVTQALNGNYLTGVKYYGCTPTQTFQTLVCRLLFETGREPN